MARPNSAGVFVLSRANEVTLGHVILELTDVGKFHFGLSLVSQNKELAFEQRVEPAEKVALAVRNAQNSVTSQQSGQDLEIRVLPAPLFAQKDRAGGLEVREFEELPSPLG
jgi:hypothetical protein